MLPMPVSEAILRGYRLSDVGRVFENAVIVRQGAYERDVDGIRILTPPESFFGERA